METEDGAAPPPRESTGGISGDIFNIESEVEKMEKENMKIRNITAENLPDCNISSRKSAAPCVFPLNETGGNTSSTVNDGIIEAVREPLNYLNLEGKDLTKTSSEIISDLNGNGGNAHESQNKANSSHLKTEPLCGITINDEANSQNIFSAQNESKLIKHKAVISDSRDPVFKQTEPHVKHKDEQTSQPEAETSEINHVEKGLEKMTVEGKTVCINESSRKRNPDENLLESAPCVLPVNSFSLEMSESCTSSTTENSDCYFNNFTVQREKFKFSPIIISKPSYSSTCLLNSSTDALIDAPCHSPSSLMFGVQTPNKVPDQSVLISKTSCTAHFDNKLILPAVSRDSAFCDFKKEITPSGKFLNQLIKIGNINSNCTSCPAQKCDGFSVSNRNVPINMNCLAGSEKIDKQSASNSAVDFNQTVANSVNHYDPEAPSEAMKTVASCKETTVPLYSSAPLTFSFQSKTGQSSFSNLSRGEFSLSQSYGKLSFQPLTTHSINFPISCSRTDSSCPQYRLEDTNSPFCIDNSPLTSHNTEKGSTNSSKSSSSFNFALRGHSEKKVNNYDENFWNSLGGKVVKTDTRRADSEAALFDSNCKSSTKKTKQPFSFCGKDSQTDKNTLHRPFSFTSFFPTLGSSSTPEKMSSVEHTTASQFQPKPVSTTSSQFQPISSENSLLNFRFKPAFSLSCNTNCVDSPPQKSTCYVVPSQCQSVASGNCKSSINPSDTAVGLPIPTSSLLPFVGGNQTCHGSPSVFQNHGSPHHTRKSRKANKLSKTSTKLPFKERVTFQFSNTGIAPVPFKNVIGNDVVVTNGSTTTYVIRYQHISCMEEYKSVSPEELRFDYYAKKNAPFSDHFFTFCAGPDSIPQSNPANQVKNVEIQTDEQGKSPIPRVALQEVWRALECPVCLDVVLPPVFQCEQGHHACASCWTKMVSCPLCKRRKSSTRNYMAETLLEQVPLPCRYHIEGCRETVQRANKLIHEQTCMYRMYQCPYHLCNQAFSYHNMCKHFKKVHKSLLHQDGYSVTNEDEFSLNIYKDQLLPSLIHAVHIPQWGLFFIRQSSVRFTTAIFVQVMHAAPDIPDLSYHVEVSDHHDCRKQSYKGRVSPLGKLVREIIELEEYLAVTDLLMKSVKKDAPVKISLTVWPRKPSLSLNLFSM